MARWLEAQPSRILPQEPGTLRVGLTAVHWCLLARRWMVRVGGCSRVCRSLSAIDQAAFFGRGTFEAQLTGLSHHLWTSQMDLRWTFMLHVAAQLNPSQAFVFSTNYRFYQVIPQQASSYQSVPRPFC